MSASSTLRLQEERKLAPMGRSCILTTFRFPNP